MSSSMSISRKLTTQWLSPLIILLSFLIEPIISFQIPTRNPHIKAPSKLLSNNNIHQPYKNHILYMNQMEAEIISPSTSTTKTPKEIVILGGGFGGINTALTLASLPWPDEYKPNITILDQKERFIFLPLLYELCVGNAELEEVAPTFQSLLSGTNINFIQCDIQGIDIDQSRVHVLPTTSNSKLSSTTTTTTTTEGTTAGLPSSIRTSDYTTKTISYDSLVVATGVSDIDLSSIPGLQNYALPFYTINDCFRLRKRLAVMESSIQVLDDFSYKKDKEDRGKDDDAAAAAAEELQEIVIVGGSYSGVELALNLVERFEQSTTAAVKITLVHRGESILPYAQEHNRKVSLDRLNKLGVNVLTECSVIRVEPFMDNGSTTESSTTTTSTTTTTAISDKEQCQVILQNSQNNQEQILKANLLLWTAGAMQSNIPKSILNSKLPRDSKGRIVTGSFLRVKGQSNIFALGDCSRAKQVPFDATAQVAMQQAPVVAWNAYATLMKTIQKEGLESSTSSSSSSSSSSSGTMKYNTEQDDLELLPFSYLDLGEMMSLGGNDATISSLGGLVELDGSLASNLRRLIYVARSPSPVASAKSWIQGNIWNTLLSNNRSRKG